MPKIRTEEEVSLSKIYWKASNGPYEKAANPTNVFIVREVHLWWKHPYHVPIQSDIIISICQSRKMRTELSHPPPAQGHPTSILAALLTIFRLYVDNPGGIR